MSRAVRIEVLLGRAAARAVVLRRGPSKQVLVMTWDTARDEFEEGQWLKGRLYEKRCDLSPDGQLLLYFAGSYRKPYYTWSAVSRPPYLTALALWPKGDAWGGGGHFESATSIALNHRANEMVLGEGFQLPPRVDVHPFGVHSGWGEDEPVWNSRLERYGWIRVSSGRALRHHANERVWIVYDPPLIWEKPHPLAPEKHTLRMTIRGVKERNGPWYVLDYAVLAGETVTHDLGRSDWADWDTSGDLLFAKDAALYRLHYGRRRLAAIEGVPPLIDLAPLMFTRREAPDFARYWPQSNGR